MTEFSDLGELSLERLSHPPRLMLSSAGRDADVRSVIDERPASVSSERLHGERAAQTRCTDASGPPLHSLRRKQQA